MTQLNAQLNGILEKVKGSICRARMHPMHQGMM
jgi:hypothetical protein